MKLSSIDNLNFKGYDALPLKRLYTNDFQIDEFKFELGEIARKENINLDCDFDFAPWVQDHLTIIKKGENIEGVASKYVSKIYLDDLEKHYSIKTENYDDRIAGGNIYLGKKENGENWAIVGSSNVKTLCDFKKIYDLYNVKMENVTIVPQVNFHIDMFLRPIGYPNVLVNDPKLVEKNIKKLNGTIAQKKQLLNDLKVYNEELLSEYKGTYEDTINALCKKGFNPIPIAGVYAGAINFMNALVNKHSDNKITYITNSTYTENPFTSQIEKVFEKELRNKVENIDDVHFLAGNIGYDTNSAMDNLKCYHGGAHCMFAEEPDFDIWG